MLHPGGNKDASDKVVHRGTTVSWQAPDEVGVTGFDDWLEITSGKEGFNDWFPAGMCSLEQI